MAWEQITREDYFEGSNSNFISVSPSHFSFNSNFAKIVELNPGSRVSVYKDASQRKLGFEFHDDDRPNSFALSAASAATKGQKRKALQCASRGVVNKCNWIKSVTKLKAKNRRFEPRKEGGRWVIQLCPAFEYRKARESADIDSDLKGIYRYIRETGEIVYIGRGTIYGRLKSPERIEWDFDTVEYSIVEDPDAQVEWEDYWIEKYKNSNGGELPFYNKVSGASKYRGE